MPNTLPVLVLGVVNAALQLLIAFGVTISDAQNAAITTAVNAALLLGAYLYDLRNKKAAKVVPSG